MMHKTRTWGAAPCDEPAELARKLGEYSWCLCSAFETAGGTIWANDSTCEDALQEYAVLRPEGEGYRQVESITVSWCSAAKLERYIRQADADAFSERLGTVAASRIERAHEPCRFCR